jgi:class 3 adenylate cyclase/predicted metal-dependent HD superfamily phosphohydrolase
MERLMNILIIDDVEDDVQALRKLLIGGGNIVLSCPSIDQAAQIIQQKDIALILVNCDSQLFSSMEDFNTLLSTFSSNISYALLMTSIQQESTKIMRGFHSGAIDFIYKPFQEFYVKTKIAHYKSLYFKDKRIGQLLGNILPRTVLDDLNVQGKYSPKRIDEGVVIFTDFVDFSLKAKAMKPLKLVKRLEYYFTRFDEILDRYKLEKIKTIGDAYMVLGGVTEDNEEPLLRACLAAIEMRNFMRNERTLAKAFKRDFWEIRIGIHTGPLVAGIIGSKRYSFDVWGDTVNIAARAQQLSQIDEITVTKEVVQQIGHYFEWISLGIVPIKKRGGEMELFQLAKLKNEYSLYGKGKFPNVFIRNKCKLQSVDFDHMRQDVIQRLKANLPDQIVYHDLFHTLNVEKAVIRLAQLEGISEEELLLLRTSALYHDIGFIYTNENNELHAVRLMEKMLPTFGYDSLQIQQIRSLILATSGMIEPQNLLEQIICDADHDYLGRADYYTIAAKLRVELENYGMTLTDKQWLQKQIDYLENIHRYYTIPAISIRDRGKQNRINELKKQLLLAD